MDILKWLFNMETNTETFIWEKFIKNDQKIDKSVLQQFKKMFINDDFEKTEKIILKLI